MPPIVNPANAVGLGLQHDAWGAVFDEIIAPNPVPHPDMTRSLRRATPLDIPKDTIGFRMQKWVTGTEYFSDLPPSAVLDFSVIGIEMEIENLPNVLDGIRYWERIPDGSLRNNGWEYVSLPIKGAHIEKALYNLKDALLTQNNPEFSGRTSVHVHLNILDMSYEQLNCLVLLYLAFERCMYGFASQRRYKNIFCVPISQCGYGAMIHSLFIRKGAFTFHNWHKYTGFNLKPVHDKGTVEFRHMPGTFDIATIITWINLIQRLKMYAMNSSFETLATEISELNTTSQYEMFLNKVFKEDSRALYSPNLNRKMEADILFVKECLLQLKPPKWDTRKFETSMLGQYILRPENKLDENIIKKDYTQMSLDELLKYKDQLAQLYHKYEGVSIVATPILQQYKLVDRHIERQFVKTLKDPFEENPVKEAF